MMYLGNEEVVLIQVPRGTHTQALKHDLNLQEMALQAIVERVRAASLADHMLQRSQLKLGQNNLTCYNAD
jgi:hypothetical protein